MGKLIEKIKGWREPDTRDAFIKLLAEFEWCEAGNIQLKDPYATCHHLVAGEARAAILLHNAGLVEGEHCEEVKHGFTHHTFKLTGITYAGMLALWQLRDERKRSRWWWPVYLVSLWVLGTFFAALISGWVGKFFT